MRLFPLRLRPWLAGLSAVLAACGSDSMPRAPVVPPVVPTPPAAPFALREASIASSQAALRSGQLSCVQLVQGYLARIAALDAAPAPLLPINSVLSLAPRALAEAAALDALQAGGGWAGSLHCVPILLKDNYDSADFPTTAASRALAGATPADDAFTVKRLRAAGAVVLGKTTMAEFAYLPQSHNSWTLRVGLPYDTTKDVGGSSSGSAAAVTANFALAATGSDTCASIRLPPSNNSLVGVRSSIGLVSQDGIVPLSHFLDVGGPITRSVEDAAKLLDVMAGVDAADPLTLDAERRQPTSYTAFLNPEGLRGKRIGVLRSYGGTDAFGSDPHVNRVMAAALEDLSAAGAVLVDPVELPDFELVSTIMILREFKTQLEEYLATVPNAPRTTLAQIIGSGQVHPVIEALLIASVAGSDTTSAAYLADKAKRGPLRTYVESEMDRLDLDALVYPPVKAPAFGTLVEADADDLLPDLIANPGGGNGNVNAVFQANTCDFSSTTGLPSIVVPAGFSTDTLPLPIGIEFFGRKWDEGRLFEIAYGYEQATRHRRPPPGLE